MTMLALLNVVVSVRDLDLYVDRFGWGYAAVPLSLVLPAVASLASGLMTVAAVRRWSGLLWLVCLAVWLACAIAYVLLPLRD